MFIALGQGLLKDDGKFAYIIPQGLLTRPSYDVLRYYLSRKMIIEKIFIFANKLFTQRGIKTKKNIITSSLIFVVRKLPDIDGTAVKNIEQLETEIQNNQVKLIRYDGEENDPITCMEDMKTRTNCTVFELKQEVLQKELYSWNHFFKGETFLNLLKKYNANSETIGIYYNHKLAMARFKSKFYFDIWYNSDGQFKGESKQPVQKYFV